MAKIVDYAEYVSYRVVGESKKKIINNPSWDAVMSLLNKVEEGNIEYLSLVGPEDEFTHMAVIAKPGHYHIGIFIDEDEEYLLQTSEMTSKKVDIAGDYWPENQVCTDWNDFVSIVDCFFKKGEPSHLFNWIHFTEDD